MIHDDLIKIKNAYLAKHKEVILPYSNLTHDVVKVLSAQGYLGEVEIVQNGSFKEIKAQLKYTEGVAHLNDLKFLSKPGRKLYARVSGLHNVRQGYGDLIVSTSQGIMTARQARQKGLGGELICEVF